MRIESLEVSGFKNFREPLKIEGFRNFNIVHGGNNIGKTNVIEVLYIVFFIVKIIINNQNNSKFISFNTLEKNGLINPYDWISIGSKEDIAILINISVENIDIGDDFYFKKMINKDKNILINLFLSPARDGFTFNFKKFIIFNDRNELFINSSFRLELVINENDKIFKMKNEKLIYFINNIFSISNIISPTKTYPRYTIISSRQQMQPISASRSAIHPDLLMQLYQAWSEPGPDMFARWERFCQYIKPFADLIGSDQPEILYRAPPENRAWLVFRTPKGRLPAHLLGMGVQQMIALFAAIAMSGASIIALEEPESALSAGLHRRLRDALRTILRERIGIDQIFMTSHSPLFDTPGEPFIGMREGPTGSPIAEWHTEDPRLFTGYSSEEAPTRQAQTSYVSPEGVVALPDFVRERLGIQHGGGVVFLPNAAERIEILTNEQALQDLGWEGDP